jgi:hypothetical protein
MKDDEIPKHRSNKDTKRWCLGKVGRKHDKQWVEDTSWRLFKDPSVVYSVEICLRCKKRFGFTKFRGQRLGPGF